MDGPRAALRGGIGVVQIALGRCACALAGRPGIVPLFVFLAALELAVPGLGRAPGRHTPWHPEHIAERYGLFTIIVLGECILAATTAIQEALTDGGVTGALIAVALGALLLVCSLWWAYFKAPPVIGHFRSLRWMIGWGYGHYVCSRPSPRSAPGSRWPPMAWPTPSTCRP